MKPPRTFNPIAGLLLCVPGFLALACSFEYETPGAANQNPDMIFQEAEYVRITNGNPEIRVEAEEVRRYEAQHAMELDEFSFQQFNAAPVGTVDIPAVNARGNAGTARMETDTGNFAMKKGLHMEVASEEITMETPEVFWKNKERILTAPGELNIVREDGTTMKGTGFTADIRSRTWEFESKVAGTVVDKEEEDSGEAAAPEEPQ